MPHVLDASTALSWAIQQERDALARTGAVAILSHGAIVPAIWRWEVQNALLVAERDGRITSSDIEAALQDLVALPIEIDSIGPSPTFGAELDIARRMALTLYDAAYIELALRRNSKLMTRDRKLGAAADALKIRWKP